MNTKDTTKFAGVEVLSVVQSLKPKNPAWMETESTLPMIPEAITHSCWFHREMHFYVISSVEKVDQEDGIDRGPEYHLSFSLQTKDGAERVSTNQANWILSQFGLEGAEEDNHVPHGKVRNFWRTVREDLIGMECICKDTEPVIKENKGDYIWRPA